MVSGRYLMLWSVGWVRGGVFIYPIHDGIETILSDGSICMDEFDKRLYVDFDMKIYNNNLLLELIAKKKGKVLLKVWFTWVLEQGELGLISTSKRL